MSHHLVPVLLLVVVFLLNTLHVQSRDHVPLPYNIIPSSSTSKHEPTPFVSRYKTRPVSPLTPHVKLVTHILRGGAEEAAPHDVPASSTSTSKSSNPAGSESSPSKSIPHFLNWNVGDGILTFSEHLSGSAFSFLCLLYGFACAIDPRGVAHVLYNHHDPRKRTTTATAGSSNANSLPDRTSVKCLLRLMGYTMLGLGFTSTFAMASELDVLGHMPSPSKLYHAVAVGTIPRLILAVRYTFWKSMDTDRIRHLGSGSASVDGSGEKTEQGKLAWRLFLLETCLFAASMGTGRVIPPRIALSAEIAFCVFVSVPLMFQPQLVFQANLQPTNHEVFLTRLTALYSLMHAVLIGALMNTDINALPSTGLAALTWGLGMAALTFITGDVGKCGSSVAAALTVVVGALGMAAGALKNYVTI